MRRTPEPTPDDALPTRHPAARALALLPTLVLLLLAGCTGATLEDGLSHRATAPAVQVSDAPDLSAARPLAGATVAGDVYVFVRPDADLLRVRLHLDGHDLTAARVGTSGVADDGALAARAKGADHPWNTRGLPNGPHRVTVEADYDAGGATHTVTDDVEFVVDNPPVPDAGDGSVDDGTVGDGTAGDGGIDADGEVPTEGDAPDAPDPDEPTDTAAPGTDRLLFGAWTAGGPWHGMEDTYFDLERRIDARLDVVHWYMSFSTRWMEDLVRSAAVDGRLPMITWEAHTESLDDIAAGVYDDRLREWGRGAAAYGDVLYLRPFQEMNADFFPWGMDPEGFVAAWRHIVEVFRAEGAHNVRWVWSPNADDNPATAENRLEHYYPGSDYVDVLAIDGYNWGTCTSWGRWRSFDEVMADAYARVAALGDAPIWIAEFGTTELGGDKARWIADALASDAFPRIEALVYFDEDTGDGCDWNLDTSEAAVQAVAEALDAWGAVPLVLTAGVR